MNSPVKVIFILLLFLSCEQKQSENDRTEEGAEISETETPAAEIEIDQKEEGLANERVPDCELRTLIEINSLIEKGKGLNDQNFAVFFANMKIDCADNAEYSEFNNELLFKTLESNPEKFVAFLSRVSRKKELLEFVLGELQNPIHDGIQLNEIYEQLEKTETEDATTKAAVSESIKTAIEKYK